MRKPGRGQILENRLVGPREVLGGGDRRVPAKGRGRTAPCRGRSGASWIWATPLTPARARGSSVRATPSLRPPRILKTSLFLQKGGPRKEPSQRTATALFYLIPCGDFQLSPQEFYLSLISQETRCCRVRHRRARSGRRRHSGSGPACLLSREDAKLAGPQWTRHRRASHCCGRRGRSVWRRDCRGPGRCGRCPSTVIVRRSRGAGAHQGRRSGGRIGHDPWRGNRRSDPETAGLGSGSLRRLIGAINGS